MKKEPVKPFDLTAAFKALDSIDIPAVYGGIRPNRTPVFESISPQPKTDCLLEDYYDVQSKEELGQAAEERKAEIAQAKLARIEKIVDLDAESVEDLAPSYIGRVICKCPQCMTLFYRDAKDLEPSEDDEHIVNVNEPCPNCGNDSGYEVVGKVDAVADDELSKYVAPEDLPAEEGEEQPAKEEEEISVEDTPTDEGNEEEVEETEEVELPAPEKEEEEEEEPRENFKPVTGTQGLVEGPDCEDEQEGPYFVKLGKKGLAEGSGCKDDSKAPYFVKLGKKSVDECTLTEAKKAKKGDKKKRQSVDNLDAFFSYKLEEDDEQPKTEVPAEEKKPHGRIYLNGKKACRGKACKKDEVLVENNLKEAAIDMGELDKLSKSSFFSTGVSDATAEADLAYIMKESYKGKGKKSKAFFMKTGR